MARKQRAETHLPVPPSEAVEICRRALLERGCQIQAVTPDRIRARAPGSLFRKRIAYELELAPADDGVTAVRIATWTSNLWSTPNDIVGRAAQDLRQAIVHDTYSFLSTRALGYPCPGSELP